MKYKTRAVTLISLVVLFQINTLSLTGGLDLKDLTYRILSRLFHPKVQILINYTGANGKYSFVDSVFCRVLKGKHNNLYTQYRI